MDHHADLPFGQPEHLRRIEDLLHRLDLQEVIARAEAADLVQPTVDGPAADLRRVGAADRAAILAPVQVALAAVTARHRVGGPAASSLSSSARPRRRQVPPRPVPHGITAASRSITVPSTGASPQAPRSAASSRTPQEMSKPTPPGETTPPPAISVAATPPIGNP